MSPSLAAHISVSMLLASTNSPDWIIDRARVAGVGCTVNCSSGSRAWPTCVKPRATNAHIFSSDKPGDV